MSSLREGIISLLIQVSAEEEIRNNLDIPLFETGLIDSMGMVELLVQLEEKLHISVSITEFTREEWATPNLIIAYIESLGAVHES
ncbi:MAG: D-alanine--poly(phosphoribitol) ligase subunit 2 [Paenibacillus sp. RIFOXYA1_FULL_44_5]|nr:MAG: D-alanine--poly(phosphoribitol) ligase subunit 2 [Paenibacillus sp. RIFOXYA1_FULL_44_5]